MMSFKSFFIISYPLGLGAAALANEHSHSAEGAASWSPLVCPLNYITGFLCPSCGMTRAFLAILKGDLGGAIEYNPLSPIIFGLIFITWALLLLKIDLVKTTTSRYAKSALLRSSTKALLFSTLIWGVYRNIHL